MPFRDNRHCALERYTLAGPFLEGLAEGPDGLFGKLKDGTTAGGPPLLGVAVGNGAGGYPPTQAMKRFADSLARQKGIKPPPGYKTSISICSAFLKEHAPKKAESETIGKLEPKPVSPAQLLYATKIAQGKDLIIPDEAKANSAAMSAWIDSNRGTKRRTRGRKTAYKPVGSAAPQSAAPTKKTRNRKAGANASQSTPAQPSRDATADSLRQQGRRDEARRPLWLGGMVCPAWC